MQVKFREYGYPAVMKSEIYFDTCSVTGNREIERIKFNCRNLVDN